jgi:hypothetical protein
VACALLVLTFNPSLAAPDDPIDQKVAKIKAAYLLNFVRFTQWPQAAFADAGASIVVAVLGRDPMGPILDQTLATRRVHDRDIVVRRHRMPERDDFASEAGYTRARGELVEALRRCHVLFVAEEQASATEWIMAQLQDQPVLTVGDDRAFIHQPVMLSLAEKSNRITFYARMKIIKTSTIRISSQLLKLARIIDSH